MKHIHQKNTSGNTYTYILNVHSGRDKNNTYHLHPAIVHHSDKFEVIDGAPPAGAQILNFSDPNLPFNDENAG